MRHVPKTAWADNEQQACDAEMASQVAALCYRGAGDDLRVLLVTSRDTGRWIVPKGWRVKGKDGPGSALQEAWEEAGVREADVTMTPIGSYAYDKGLADGTTLPVRAQVYAARVTRLKDAYPEVDERERDWVTPIEAANRVDEPELKELLRSFGGKAA